MKTVYGLPPRTRYGAMALDLEIFRARKEQLHRPHGEFASLGISDGKTVWMIENVAQVEKALDRIRGCRLIFHNAGFDVRHLRRWADLPCPKSMDDFWDTYIVERLLWGGWYESFGLRDLARRRLGIYLDKETREEYSDAKELTPEMRAYAAKDPWATHRIYQKQEAEMDRDAGSQQCWNEVDAPFLWASLDFSGIVLDTRKWKALADEYLAKADEISDKLGFNPGSSPQTRAALAKVGIKVDSTREEFLLPYRGNKVVDLILEYREAAKRSSSYGDNILAMVEADGRVYSNIKTIGAETGRTAADGPNIQNQPNEQKYRECYIALRGWRFIAADYSKQEPCIMAELSRDAELMRMLENGENVHLEVAKLVFNDPTLQEYGPDGRKSKQYRAGKTLNLGLSYGMTAKGLQAKEPHLTLAQCEILVDRYFQRLRGVKQYIDRYRALGREDGYVRTLGGRRIWLNWYGYKANNNAINGPMQGTGADMMKYSINLMHRKFLHGEYGNRFPIIAPIHDEMIADCQTKDAKRLARDIEQAMTQAFQRFCPNVKAKYIAEVNVGSSWAEKA